MHTCFRPIFAISWFIAPLCGGCFWSTPSAEVSSNADKRMFVTRSKFSGNLSGLSGADAKCQTAANAAGLKGTYIAFLSTSAVDASTRVTGPGPWSNTLGARVFDSAAGWAGFPKGYILADELGSYVGGGYWTGSGPQGTRTQAVCGDWRSVTDSVGGIYGTGGSSSEWLSSSVSPCSSDLSLLCLQND